MKPQTTSRTVRIFISSTFLDLQQERHLLARKGIPRVAKRCRELGLDFVAIDLRWGITEEEARQRQTVLRCLAAVDSCRPYFIGILGGRYGWIPTGEITEETFAVHPWLREVSDRSITELEILHALKKSASQALTPFFYLMSARDTHTQSQSEIEAQRALREQVASSGHHCRLDVASAEELVEAVCNDLITQIEKDFPEASLSAEEEADAAQDACAGFLRSVYRPRPEIDALVESLVTSPEQLIVLTGPEGSGKSCLAAAVMDRFRETYPDEIAFEHYFQPAGSIADVRDRFCRRVSEEEDFQEVSSVREMLNLTARPTLLLLDGIDELSEEEQRFDWLPRQLPQRIRVLVTTREESLSNSLVAKGFEKIAVPGMSRDAGMKLLEQLLGDCQRRIDTGLLSRLGADTPLGLRLILQDLLLCKSPEEAERAVGIFSQCTNLEQIAQRVIERLLSGEEGELLSRALGFLSICRVDLSHEELADLCSEGGEPVPQSRFYPILLDLTLIAPDFAGRISFPYKTIRRITQILVFQDVKACTQAHKDAAAYFLSLDRSTRTANEAVYHLLAGGDWETVAKVLSDPADEILFLLNTAQAAAACLHLSKGLEIPMSRVIELWIMPRFEAAEAGADRTDVACARLILWCSEIERQKGLDLPWLMELQKRIKDIPQSVFEFEDGPKLICLDSLVDGTAGKLVDELIHSVGWDSLDHAGFMVSNAERMLFDFLFGELPENESFALTREEVFRQAKLLIQEAFRIFYARADYEGRGEELDDDLIAYRTCRRDNLRLGHELEALMLQHEGDPQGAITILQECLKEQESFVGVDHESLRSTVNELYIVFMGAGMFDDALASAKRGLELSMKDGQPLDPDSDFGSFRWLKCISCCERDRDNPFGILAAFNQYQRIRTPSTDPAFEELFLNLLEYYQSKRAELVALMLSSAYLNNAVRVVTVECLVRIQATAFLAARVEDHEYSEQERSCLVIMGLLFDRDDLNYESAAIEVANLLITFCASKLGQEDIVTLWSWNSLAILLGQLGLFNESKDIFLRTIAARESILGPEHQHTIESVNSLADLLRADNRLQESLQLLRGHGAKSGTCFAGVRFKLAGHECLSGNLDEAMHLLAEEIAADPEKRQQALDDEGLAAIRDFIQILGRTGVG